MIRGSYALVGDSLPVVGMLGAVSILSVVAWQVSSALSEARRVHAMQEHVVASLVAEEAAQTAVDRFGAGRTLVHSVTIASPTGLTSRVEALVSRSGTRLRIRVVGARGRVHLYQCPLLPGAAPEWLGQRLTLSAGVLRDRPELVEWLETDLGLQAASHHGDLARSARLDQRALQTAPDRNHEILEQNPSIGILRLPAGTDRPDFVFGGDGRRVVRPRVPFGGVMLVRGNLWVDQGSHPLIVELEGSLTIVVEGNIYLGRTVVVRGSGRLTLVARQGAASTFRDADGDGTWSAGDTLLGVGERGYGGPVEGGGMVYLGLPGARQEPAGDLDFVASILAEGEIYVRAKTATVHGAVLGGYGITRLDSGRLRLPGTSLPNTQRATLPGFVRAGAVRPGVLVELR